MEIRKLAPTVWQSQLLYSLENDDVVLAHVQHDRIADDSFGETSVELAVAETLLSGGWVGGGRRLLLLDLDEACDARCETYGEQSRVVLLGQHKFLLMAMKEDPLMLKSSVVVFKPGRESRRRLEVDLVAGLLRKIQKRRREAGRPLRVVVLFSQPSSRSLWKSFWDLSDERTLSISKSGENGKSDIQIAYSARDIGNYFDEARRVVSELARAWGSAGFKFPFFVLVFMVTVQEVEGLVGEMGHSEQDLQVVGLSAGMSPAERARAVQSPRDVLARSGLCGKVLVTTNVAEDMEISDLTHVVDCGLFKVSVGTGYEHSPVHNMKSVVVIPESRTMAAKRAGKVANSGGFSCIRLFTEQRFENLADVMPPEILTENLSPLILRLKLIGVENPLHFRLPTRPSGERIAKALESLTLLGYMDENTGALTNELGRSLATLHPALVSFPELGKAILESVSLCCADEVCSIAALVIVSLSNSKSGSIFQNDQIRTSYAVAEGDLFTLLNVYQSFVGAGGSSRKWCARKSLNYGALQSAVRLSTDIRSSLTVVKLLSGTRSPESLETRVGRALTAGLFQSSAVLAPNGGYYPLWTSSSLSRRSASQLPTLTPHPSSVLHRRYPPLVIYCQCLQTPDAAHMTLITVTKEEWLTRAQPNLFKAKTW